MNILGTIFGAILGSFLYFTLVCFIFYYRNETHFTNTTNIKLLDNDEGIFTFFRNDIVALSLIENYLTWVRRFKVFSSLPTFWLRSVIWASIPVIVSSILSSFIVKFVVKSDASQIILAIILVIGFIIGHRLITVPFNKAKKYVELYIKQIETQAK